MSDPQPEPESGGVAPAETPSNNVSYVVRYGTMKKIGEFTARVRDRFSRGDEVIVRSTRGVEWGEVLCESNKRTREYMKSDGKGRILRDASDEDRRSWDATMEKEAECFATGSQTIADRSMQMQLVDVELIFGGERLVFYYLAEQRVDFRELVKDLARQFKTRIEMRHIGVRDEARLLADYGDCGKPVCCNTHLQEMPPVSMKMAKLQKATLDPNKISGRCGRLKCCLRYEYDTYQEYKRDLPRMGATVITREGQGRVVGQELLARKLVLAMDGGNRSIVSADDIVTVVSKAKSGDKSENPENKPSPQPTDTPPETDAEKQG